MKKIITIIVLAILLSSCTTIKTSGVVTGNNYPPLSPTENVKVILSGESPEVEVIGMIQVIAASAYYDDIQVIVEEAKVKAASMGANIILLEGRSTLLSETQGTTGSTDANGVYHAGTSGGTTESPKYTFIAGRIIE